MTQTKSGRSDENKFRDELTIRAVGGGNQFGQALSRYLREQGVEVFFDLKDPNLDLILLTEPRSALRISAYSDKDIVKYLLRKNWQTIVVHRINECDERKGTTSVNRRLMRANFSADHTVFISRWLQDLFLSQGLKMPAYNVILNGANPHIFYANGYKSWDKNSKLKLVTHHWGASHLKGFDVYKLLDTMLSEPEFGQKVEFTYIGNLPQNFQFSNVRHIPPQSGLELAQSIRSHHVYLTASQYEPAGMHHIEGALCGLPLLYRESGALPEYCSGFGLGFTSENFVEKLHEMIEAYDHWVNQMQAYPHTAEQMCENYYQLFLNLLNHRVEIVKQRQWWHKPHFVAHALLPW